MYHWNFVNFSTILKLYFEKIKFKNFINLKFVIKVIKVG